MLWDERTQYSILSEKMMKTCLKKSSLSAMAFFVRGGLAFIHWKSSSQDTLKMVKKRVRSLAGFQPVCYSCCINSCVCFVGKYEDLDVCPNWKEARFKANGKLRKYYNYMPIIPQLQAMSVNSIHASSTRNYALPEDCILEHFTCGQRV